MLKSSLCLLTALAILSPIAAHATCRNYARDTVADRENGTDQGVACEDPGSLWHIQPGSSPTASAQSTGEMQRAAAAPDRHSSLVRTKPERPYYFTTQPENDDTQGVTEY